MGNHLHRYPSELNYLCSKNVSQTMCIIEWVFFCISVYHRPFIGTSCFQDKRVQTNLSTCSTRSHNDHFNVILIEFAESSTLKNRLHAIKKSNYGDVKKDYHTIHVFQIMNQQLFIIHMIPFPVISTLNELSLSFIRRKILDFRIKKSS